jgi:hypothetical protein
MWVGRLGSAGRRAPPTLAGVVRPGLAAFRRRSRRLKNIDVRVKQSAKRIVRLEQAAEEKVE